VKYQTSGNPITNAYKVKNRFHLEEEGTAIIFLRDFRSRCSPRLHKIC